MIPRNWSPPEAAVCFVPLRAQGPGGQHVNRTESAVQLRFDTRLAGLPPMVQSRLRLLAGRRIDADGVIVMKAQAARSQALNRKAVLVRLVALVADAFNVPIERRPTKPTRLSIQHRLDNKKRQARVKAYRRASESSSD